MRLPDDGYESERISPVIIALIFITAIVVLVLWINRDRFEKKDEPAVLAGEDAGVEQEIVEQSTSTLTPEDFDFWEKYPETTPEPVLEATPEPIAEDPATDGKHTKIINDEGEEEWIEIDPDLQKHSYDFTKLVKKEDILKYYEDGKELSFVGVDLSKYQEYVDFAKLKKAGIDFCMLRVGARGYGTGQLVLDSYFQENIKRATDAGLDIGVYFFSQAVTIEEAEEEARMVLEYIQDYEVNYPVVFDMEYVENDTARVEQLSKEEKTLITQAFLEEVELEGYTPMIYGKKEWLLTKIDLGRLVGYDIWLADYSDIPDYPYQFSMWQYTNQGKVEGVSGKVDLNISFIDYTEK
ncbi:MAG: glycoside hydrolase family 25 protein [Lachnospiraceae bacterium]|nr:glycoside hydrolase family 25 protein [Lachnospiraceae bacterium]